MGATVVDLVWTEGLAKRRLARLPLSARAEERTTIGGFDIFGMTVWAGWPMLVGLAYTGIPSYFLGRAKLRLAPMIHDKVLYADAEMNRADWMAEAAAAAGVIGTGLGIWWADAAAAGLVSIDILRTGRQLACCRDRSDGRTTEEDGEQQGTRSAARSARPLSGVIRLGGESRGADARGRPRLLRRGVHRTRTITRTSPNRSPNSPRRPRASIGASRI